VANIKSSKKDARRSALKAIRNRSVKSAVKTKVQKFRRADAAGEEPENLQVLALTAISGLDRAAEKGILHRNNAARRKGRLQKRLNAATKSE
jgi:small subunit ribosomal protein S20